MARHGKWVFFGIYIAVMELVNGLEIVAYTRNIRVIALILTRHRKATHARHPNGVHASFGISCFLPFHLEMGAGGTTSRAIQH